MDKIERYKLTDQAFQKIKNKIRSGEWVPGDKIPSEIELAAQLGISRMSLRVALQKANLLGLVETRIGEGTFVSEFSLQTYFDQLYQNNLLPMDSWSLSQFRAVIHIGVIALIIDMPDAPERCKHLTEIYEKMEAAASADDIETVCLIDAEFHRELCSILQNDLLSALYAALFDPIIKITSKNILYNNPTDYSRVLSYHKNVLDSILNRDLDLFIKREFANLEMNANRYKENKEQEI